jgi:uncharacterized coiled-coil DUF342 family protein
MGGRGMNETREAVERWQQGKVNIFDEMARIEQQRDEAREEVKKWGDLVDQMSESNQVLLAEVREYRKKAESVPVSSNETNLKLALEEVANMAKTLKQERDEAREVADLLYNYLVRPAYEVDQAIHKMMVMERYKQMKEDK